MSLQQYVHTQTRYLLNGVGMDVIPLPSCASNGEQNLFILTASIASYSIKPVFPTVKYPLKFTREQNSIRSTSGIAYSWQWDCGRPPQFASVTLRFNFVLHIIGHW